MAVILKFITVTQQKYQNFIVYVFLIKEENDVVNNMCTVKFKTRPTNLFHQNDSKGCNIDYLNMLRPLNWMHFAIGHNVVLH